VVGAGRREAILVEDADLGRFPGRWLPVDGLRAGEFATHNQQGVHRPVTWLRDNREGGT
jgi:hypothetical protein